MKCYSLGFRDKIRSSCGRHPYKILGTNYQIQGYSNQFNDKYLKVSHFWTLPLSKKKFTCQVPGQILQRKERGETCGANSALEHTAQHSQSPSKQDKHIFRPD